VIVAPRLEPDGDGQSEAPQDLDQALVIVGGVQHRHPPPARLDRDDDRHLMTVPGSVDAYQNAGIRRSIGLGHGRVSLWCGSQNHHRDLSPGYGRPLRDLGAARTAIAFSSASFPTCYGTHFTDPKGDGWTAAEVKRLLAEKAHFRCHSFSLACAQNNIDHRPTKPHHPWTNGQVERMNPTIKDATVRRHRYESHDRLREHLKTFLEVNNFAKRLKTLKGLTVFEFISAN
jgi:hypothetical protein